MKTVSIAAAVIFTVVTAGYSEVKLGDKTSIVFATAEQGRKILTKRDDFIRRLSPFDRSSILRTDKEVSGKAFLAFVSKSVLEWTDQEKAAIEPLLAELKPQLEALHLPWMKTIWLIKSSGDEEGGLPYTRSNAIVLPKHFIPPTALPLQKVLAHELFHVLSRANPILREKLYASIGYEQCNEIELPPELKARKITNPDSPRNDHCIRLQVDGAPVWAVPLIFSREEKYDVSKGGVIFNYLQFQFLIVDRKIESGRVVVTCDKNNVRLVGTDRVSGFYEQVGRNSHCDFHPEETVADNFMWVVFGEKRVPSSDVLARIRKILEETGNR